MGTITRHTSKGQLCVYTFGQDTVAASQSDARLNVALAENGETVDHYQMPFEGDIVAIAWALSAAATAGSLTIGPTIDDVEQTDVQATAGTDAGGYVRLARGASRILANGELGVEINTDGSWDATTSDLVVQVYVLHDLEGI